MIRVHPVTYLLERYSLVVTFMGLTFHKRQSVMRLDLMWINGEKSQLTGRQNSQNTKRELIRSLVSSPRFFIAYEVSVLFRQFGRNSSFGVLFCENSNKWNVSHFIAHILTYHSNYYIFPDEPKDIIYKYTHIQHKCAMIFYSHLPKYFYFLIVWISPILTGDWAAQS